MPHCVQLLSHRGIVLGGGGGDAGFLGGEVLMVLAVVFV